MKLSERMLKWAKSEWKPSPPSAEDMDVMVRQSMESYAIQVKELEARIAALEEAVPYAVHKSVCATQTNRPGPGRFQRQFYIECDCGLYDALAKLEESDEEPRPSPRKQMMIERREQSCLDRHGLGDWTIEDAEDGYCWYDQKRIQRIPGDYSLFLHEVAHALAYEEGWPGEGFHGGLWADKFTDLVREEFD